MNRFLVASDLSLVCVGRLTYCQQAEVDPLTTIEMYLCLTSEIGLFGCSGYRVLFEWGIEFIASHRMRALA